jgi:hypothetical protein
MAEAPIISTFVSHVVPLGFADAADAADRLAGTDVTAGRVRLEVKERIGDGFAGAVWYRGVLHGSGALLPPVRVDIVVSPWSAGRTEVGLRPLSRIGRADSFRAGRFFAAAWAILPRFTEELAARRATGAPAPTGVRVAA